MDTTYTELVAVPEEGSPRAALRGYLDMQLDMIALLSAVDRHCTRHVASAALVSHLSSALLAG